MDDSTSSLVDHWLRTWIRVSDGEFWIDVDEPTPDPTRIGRLVLPLAVITAWNPSAIPMSRLRNDAADTHLRKEFDTSGRDYAPAIGRAMDGTWEEPGYAVAGLTESEAVELGRRYGQLAVFWVTESAVVVLGVVDPATFARPRGAPQDRGPRSGPDINRFVVEQKPVYASVLDELRQGRKTGHWIWFIFPQIAGLGHSGMSRRFAIASLEEARAYLDNPVLGARLRECASILLETRGASAEEILGSPHSMP